jgi:hypothetical protein
MDPETASINLMVRRLLAHGLAGARRLSQDMMRLRAMVVTLGNPTLLDRSPYQSPRA